jgi:NAD(P)-dependent dehydrogenase (short-subunit alcohol dehydrogenase family)
MPVIISGSLVRRRALVTGGSKGTGAAIAGRLTEGGTTVMTTARTMPDSHARRLANGHRPGGRALRRPEHPYPHRRRLARELRRPRRTQ